MDSADEFFFHHFICVSDDSSSDDEEEILAAVLVHHHLNSQRPLFRGSIPGHLPALNRNRESGISFFGRTTLIQETRCSNITNSTAGSV